MTSYVFGTMFLHGLSCYGREHNKSVILQRHGRSMKSASSGGMVEMMVEASEKRLLVLAIFGIIIVFYCGP